MSIVEITTNVCITLEHQLHERSHGLCVCRFIMRIELEAVGFGILVSVESCYEEILFGH